jgi:hypothetical protein
MLCGGSNQASLRAFPPNTSARSSRQVRITIGLSFFQVKWLMRKQLLLHDTVTKTRPNVAVVPNVGKKTKL